MQTIDDLLGKREVQNLKYMSWTRIVLSLIGIITNLIANSAYTGEIYLNISMFIVIWAVVIFVNAGFLWWLRRGEHLALIGYTGVLIDALALWIIPEIWYRIAGGSEVPLGFFFKFPITMSCFITLAISCLAMKPQYPAVITSFVLLNHLYYFMMVVSDPATQFSANLLDVYFGPAVNVDTFVSNIVLFLLTGGTLVFFTHLARKNVYEAASLEHETTVIREQQLRMVMQGKMDSLKGLVAGFTHEVNTPIGVIHSGIDLSDRCTQKIMEAVETSQTLEALKASSPLQKSLMTLNMNISNSKTAAERISTIVSSLKNFARLDEAEFQVVNLHLGLDSALTLMDKVFQDRIVIEREYGELPEIGCNPTEINQVFNNILTNAAQAIEGNGTIRIQTAVEDERAVIRITDTGVGLSPEQLQSIFEPAFSKKSPRVKVGLGLFSSYHIIQNHLGDLQVLSRPGKETTVVIKLPYGLKSDQIQSVDRAFTEQEGRPINGSNS